LLYFDKFTIAAGMKSKPAATLILFAQRCYIDYGFRIVFGKRAIKLQQARKRSSLLRGNSTRAFSHPWLVHVLIINPKL